MLIHEAKVGMRVYFGRGNGEQTLGEIVKINRAKAKVKTLEGRGSGRGSFAGAVWGVPYSMMRPADGTVTTNVADPADDAVKAFAHGDVCIMEAILDCYVRLSPEFLTADGERPLHEVHRLRNSLNTRLSHLFRAFGRPVSETAAYQWDEERKKQKV